MTTEKDTRKIFIFEEKYYSDLALMMKVIGTDGELFWMPRSRRLYGFGDHQSMYMQIAFDDITFDVLGESAAHYRFHGASYRKFYLVEGTPEGEFKGLYQRFYTLGEEVQERLILKPEILDHLPDALRYRYAWRIGSGKLTFIKNANVNYLVMNSHKVLLGRFDNGHPTMGIILIKNTDEKPRSLKMVKKRIKNRAHDAYCLIFKPETE